MTFGKLRGLAPSVIAMLAITLCVACATTRSLTDVERSGFLGDYSDLRPGGEGEAALVWVAPSMDFAAYDAIMIDSVTLWYASPESERLSAEDEQALTAQLYDALNRELAASYRIV